MSDIRNSDHDQDTEERLRRLRSLVKAVEATSDKVSQPVGTQFFQPNVSALPSKSSPITPKITTTEQNVIPYKAWD
jgi:hypothetical protein